MRYDTVWYNNIVISVERIRSSYGQIGKRTGAPFFALVYPYELERTVLKEWEILTKPLHKEFTIKTIDVLDITMCVINGLGLENVVESISQPMPGSNPEAELGHKWIDAIIQSVNQNSRDGKKILIVIQNLAALYPAVTPRVLMQELWDEHSNSLECPIVFLIPGTLKDSRVYNFVDKQEEFMYRGEII